MPIITKRSAKDQMTLGEFRELTKDWPDDLVFLDSYWSFLCPAYLVEMVTPDEYWYDKQNQFPNGYVRFPH